MKKLLILIFIFLCTVNQLNAQGAKKYAKEYPTYTYKWNGTHSDYLSLCTYLAISDTNDLPFIPGSPNRIFTGNNFVYANDYVTLDTIDTRVRLMQGKQEDIMIYYRNNPFDADILQPNVQTQIDGKQPVNSNLTSISALTTTSFGRGLLTETNVSSLRASLSVNNVDNTSDANKPVSTAQQTALNGKQNTLVSGTNIKTINGNSLLGSGNLTIANTDYYNTVNVAGGAGQAIFYLTSDKNSTGTALYSTIDAVIPIINDATQNYTYGWSYNAGTKALTVTAKTNLTAVISLLTVVLGPTNVANGVPIQVVVKGH